MILLDGIIEGILGFLAFCALSFVFVWVPTALISKLTKTKIVMTRTRDEIANPEDFDYLKEVTLDLLKKVFIKIKKTHENDFNLITNNDAPNNVKLNKLTELYTEGIITFDEYILLKKNLGL
ncbi:hypothetical protein SDC9_68632 [bioreactor metagenome]|uniref:SHOCT domain-containing protein n=1 Tax=bioreactor metagenome TaxID=1076179 RepID=A0A644Y2N2_9ZZZZ|nr:hypothetical protein [Paludibacter sp.]